MKQSTSPNCRRPGGFSLIELLVVVSIVAIMAAVSLPGIVRYLRNYQIRGATQQVAGEIQAARNKAIARNVNLGVVFLVMDSTRYRWVLEDTLFSGAEAGSRRTLSQLLTTPDPLDASLLKYRDQLGPQRQLPRGIIFGTGCPGFAAANDKGFRFNRLGGWCDPAGSTGTCPDLDAGASLVENAAAGTTVCLAHDTTGLRRTVTVTPGGRVLVQP